MAKQLKLAVSPPDAVWAKNSTRTQAFEYEPRFYAETPRGASRHQGLSIRLMLGSETVSEGMLVIGGDGKMSILQQREVEPELLNAKSEEAANKKPSLMEEDS